MESHHAMDPAWVLARVALPAKQWPEESPLVAAQLPNVGNTHITCKDFHNAINLARDLSGAALPTKL